MPLDKTADSVEGEDGDDPGIALDMVDAMTSSSSILPTETVPCIDAYVRIDVIQGFNVKKLSHLRPMKWYR